MSTEISCHLIGVYRELQSSINVLYMTSHRCTYLSALLRRQRCLGRRLYDLWDPLTSPLTSFDILDSLYISGNLLAFVPSDWHLLNRLKMLLQA
jgi:hypothetical protein